MSHHESDRQNTFACSASHQQPCFSLKSPTNQLQKKLSLRPAPQLLVYLTHGPVKELMDRTVLLLMGASPVQQNNASGGLSPGQKPVRHTGTSCVRGGVSCARLIPLFFRPQPNRCRRQFKHRQRAAKHVSTEMPLRTRRQ